MEAIFDLITLPFELLGGALKCMCLCLAVSMLACCGLSAFAMYQLGAQINIF